MSYHQSPYENLSGEAFWSLSIAQKNALQISGLWKPKHSIDKTHSIVTAGSCFAQHISRALRSRGFNWHDSEPAPADLPVEEHSVHNYGVFSFRTGNIYTVALLRQWIDWSLDDRDPESLEIWGTAEGRFIDPFRPNVVPDGFESRADLIEARRVTFAAIRDSLKKADVFVFTLGLTEAWENIDTGCVYPMCPGTLAGKFDSDIHRFVNYQYPDIRQALRQVMSRLREINPTIRFLLTVSPVPLTATASGQHVLTATIHSKSVLRAVAGDLVQSRPDTDYFPSFEIISSFPFRGMFYQPNLRNVAQEGVDFVMKAFFAGQKDAFGSDPRDDMTDDPDQLDQEVCEEALLDMVAGPTAAERPTGGASRVCIVGNSHLGVVSKCWQTDMHKQTPHIAPTFFGAAGFGILSLSVVDGALQSSDKAVGDAFEKMTDGRRSAVLADYDQFVLYGLAFPVKWLATILNGWQKASADINWVLPEDQLEQAFTRKLGGNAFVKLAIAIREASGKPVFLGVAPMWSVLERDADPAHYQIISDHGWQVSRIYHEVLRRMLGASGVGLVEQASHTLEHPCFTQAQYSMGYGVKIRDHGHMSAQYGAIALGQLLNAMAQFHANEASRALPAA